MKTVLAFTTLMILTSSAFATSLELPVTTAKGQANLSVADGLSIANLEVTGKAARLLYNSLDVEPEGSFGLVQTQTKRTDTVECVQAILGDIPGQMSKANYTCNIMIYKK